MYYYYIIYMIYKYPYALYYGYYSLHYVMSKIIKKEDDNFEFKSFDYPKENETICNNQRFGFNSKN